MKPISDEKDTAKHTVDKTKDIETQALAEAAEAQQKPDPDKLSGLKKPR